MQHIWSTRSQILLLISSGVLPEFSSGRVDFAAYLHPYNRSDVPYSRSYSHNENLLLQNCYFCFSKIWCWWCILIPSSYEYNWIWGRVTLYDKAWDQKCYFYYYLKNWIVFMYGHWDSPGRLMLVTFPWSIYT